METVAKLRKIPTSARKTRKIANIIRNQPVLKALDMLKYLPHRPVPYIVKLLQSAVSDLQYKNKTEKILKTALHVEEIYVDKGKVLKRIHPRAQGRACQVRKQTCHITVKLVAKTSFVASSQGLDEKGKKEAVELQQTAVAEKKETKLNKETSLLPKQQKVEKIEQVEKQMEKKQVKKTQVDSPEAKVKKNTTKKPKK